MLSETLRQNGWSAVQTQRIAGPLGSERAVEAWGEVCGNRATSTETRVCDRGEGGVFYLSPETGRVYRFRYQGNGSKTTVGEAQLLGLMRDGGWADLPGLFDGGWNCTVQGLAGGDVVHAVVSFGVFVSCVLFLWWFWFGSG